MSKFWQHFISNGRGSFDCRSLGLLGHVAPLPRSLAGRFGWAQQNGVEVWDVEPGGPADQAGIEEEDVIVSFADRPMSSRGALNQVLKHVPSGVPQAVVLVRGRRRLERWLVPGDASDPARPR